MEARRFCPCSANYRGRDEVPIAIRGLCPLLQVFDMPTSLRLYRDVLGFAENISKSEGTATMCIGRGYARAMQT